jgi:alpha-1,6-mannosyltransferase
VKIVDISGFYSETGGGVASYVRQKLAAASRCGHEVVIIAPGARARVESRVGGRIVWVEAPPMPFDSNYHVFTRAQAAWRVVADEAPDVIEGSSPWRGGWIAAKAPAPPSTLRALVFHQDFIAGYPYTLLDRVLPRPRIDRLFGAYWAYVRRLSARFDVTVTGGEWLAERLGRFGLHNPVAVPFGIETAHFSPSRRDEGVRRELLAACGAAPTDKLLIAVGRLHPEKRHGAILDGFAHARAVRPDLALAVIGDGPAKAAVARQVAKTPGAALLAPIADRARLARIYASADLLVHGSGAETYGLVVAEAIASGLPVVAPDSGGAADLAWRGRSRLYRTGHGEACGVAILDLLAELETGARGGPTGAPPGDSEAHFTDLFALYQRLLAEKRTSISAQAA